MNLRQLFLTHVAQTSPAPVMLDIGSAQGMYLYDRDGKAYLDLISGIGVSVLGHCHPEVVQAVQKQASQFMHTMVYGEFVLAPQVELAKYLTDLLPPRLNSTYFVNSGAEAVEGAMKLAKQSTGRHKVFACRNAYHGSTQGAQSLMDSGRFTDPTRPLLPGIHFITFNHPGDLEQIDRETACVVIETVQGEAGLIPPEPGYLQAVRERCDETGALLILDEIQAGCGRTGKMFAFEHFGIVPDILLLAKGFGGGMPIGAFIADREVMSTFSHDVPLSHITTWGGHPVNCAASLATLKTLVRQELVQQVERKKQLFLERLDHPAIVAIREFGLWFALDLESEEYLQKAVRLGLEKGLWFDWFLFRPDSIRLAPPLIITEADIDKACILLMEIFEEVSR